MKSLFNNRYLYKIGSKRLAEANWDLTIERKEALENNELVALASSATLRMIDGLNGIDYKEKEIRIKQLKKEIGDLIDLLLKKKERNYSKQSKIMVIVGTKKIKL